MKSPKCLDCNFRHFSWEDCGADSKEEDEAPAPEPNPEPDPGIQKLLEDRLAQASPGVVASMQTIVEDSFQEGTARDGSGGLSELTSPKPKKKTKPKKKKTKRKSTPKDVERVTRWRNAHRAQYNATARSWRKRKKEEKESAI